MEEPRAYTLEVFVKSVHAPGQQAIKNSLGVAVRFLDYPMLLIRPSETTLDEQAVNGSPHENVFVFSSGKSCVFSSQPDELAAQLGEASARGHTLSMPAGVLEADCDPACCSTERTERLSHASHQVPLYLLLVDLSLAGSPRLIASSSMPLTSPPASAAAAAQARERSPPNPSPRSPSSRAPPLPLPSLTAPPPRRLPQGMVEGALPPGVYLTERLPLVSPRGAPAGSLAVRVRLRDRGKGMLGHFQARAGERAGAGSRRGGSCPSALVPLGPACAERRGLWGESHQQWDGRLTGLGSLSAVYPQGQPPVQEWPPAVVVPATPAQPADPPPWAQFPPSAWGAAGKKTPGLEAPPAAAALKPAPNAAHPAAQGTPSVRARPPRDAKTHAARTRLERAAPRAGRPGAHDRVCAVTSGDPPSRPQ